MAMKEFNRKGHREKRNHERTQMKPQMGNLTTEDTEDTEKEIDYSSIRINLYFMTFHVRSGLSLDFRCTVGDG